jgi:segregation and condensation protein A
MYTVKQEKFEGPLELLLELIEKEKLNINDISLAKVADEFVAHIKTLEQIDREQLAEFLVVASQLILIKSRALLPRTALSEEEKYSMEELERRLEEYRRMRECAKTVKDMLGAGRLIWTRELYSGMPAVFYPPKSVSGEILSRMLRGVIDAIPKIEKLAEEKIRKIISLEEKIKNLQLLLREKVERAFSELVGKGKDKIEIIVSFLAILELTKQKLISVSQESRFGEIMVKKE